MIFVKQPRNTEEKCLKKKRQEKKIFSSEITMF